MPTFELVLALLLAGVALTLLAPRLGVPWPVLLAAAGAVLALVPGAPAVSLDPRLALALFVAPVLMDAAFDTSLRDLRDNWAPMLSLVVVLVLLTAAAVAAVARWVEPGLSWPAALALGAIVAPPDASAATAILREVRLPHRTMLVLEGESLLNDATALLVYRLAVTLVAGGGSGGSAVLGALGAAAGGVVLGLVLGRLYFAALVRVRDWAASVVLQFLGTFAMWLLADALHLSAVLTLVAFAMVLARYGPERMGARDRRATYAVWEAAIFALNILAFIMIGLQLRGVTARLDGAIWHSLGFAAAVLATAILVRLAWVMTYVGFLIWKNRHFAVAGRPPRAALQTGPTFQTGLVVSWCGMRGIVTLAAALALPPTFPYRDLIVFTAFCVVLGTLVLQGATLRPLLRRLTLPRDDSMKREKLLARAEAARAALAALEGHRDEQAAQLLVQEYESLLRDPSIVRADPTGVGALRSRALAAERDCLAALRRKGRIGDDVFHLIEEELDWLQAEFDPHPR